MEVGYKPIRDELGRILPGQPPLNPKGRPPQKTMKEFAREWFLQLSNEDKISYLTNLEKVRPGFAWTMSEGNPTEDKNITLKVPTPILGGSSQAITASEPQTTLSSPQHGLDTHSARNVDCAHIVDVPSDDVSMVDTTQSSVLAEEIMDA